MLPADDVVEDLTRNVFETVVGQTASRLAPCSIGTCVAYGVDVSGAWSGSFDLEIGESLAARLAGTMLETTSPAPEDVTDAMCELANVIGGNLKGMVPGPSRLSVPRCSPPSPVGHNGRRHIFVCDGEPFSVTLRSHQTESSEP